MTNIQRNLVIGLHGSGKTTYIAALWHIVESGEITSALRLKALDGDRTHLNKLRAAWLRCEPVGRTSQQGEKYDIRMQLEATSDRRVTEMWMPDMSGESFRDFWAYRKWPKAFDELVADAHGAIVFVHPGAIVQPIRVDAVNRLRASLPESPPGSSSPPPVPTSWDAKKAPTQVQLVELLQFVAWRRPPVPLHVALIVSAWDIVRGLGMSPREWCARQLPLLAQFLEHNADSLRVRYYGVSAQGGVLPADADRLAGMTLASERVELVDEDSHVSHDITIPIQRLADGGA